MESHDRIALDGPRERRPKYKDLALQQPPRNFALFLPRCVVFFVCSRREDPSVDRGFPLLQPPSSKSSHSPESFLRISSEGQAGLAWNQSLLATIRFRVFIIEARRTSERSETKRKRIGRENRDIDAKGPGCHLHDSIQFAQILSILIETITLI